MLVNQFALGFNPHQAQKVNALAIASAMPSREEIDLLKRDSVNVYEYKGVNESMCSEFRYPVSSLTHLIYT